MPDVIQWQEKNSINIRIREWVRGSSGVAQLVRVGALSATTGPNPSSIPGPVGTGCLD